MVSIHCMATSPLSVLSLTCAVPVAAHFPSLTLQSPEAHVLMSAVYIISQDYVLLKHL